MSKGRYEIIHSIGTGGLGTVYKARDVQLNRFVALKRLHRSDATKDAAAIAEEDRKLLQEASLTGVVQHPNIVSVYDGGIDEHGAFIVMEYVEGETFSEVIQRGTLTLRDFIEVVQQTLEGLISAHEKGLLHRDLKPQNLMICWLPSGSYRVKILDFGLAKYAPLPAHQTTDQDQAIYGSIYYMAPEQFRRARLDVRTDLYAMGCIYYYGLTAMTPFQGEDPPEIMKAHLQGRVIPVHYVRKDLPRAMGEWLMMLISRDAVDRPRNAEAALERFQACLPMLRSTVPKAVLDIPA